MSEKLAIHGGNPVRNKPLNYGRHWVDEDDIKAVTDVLRSDWLTMGSKIGEFEESMARYTGAQHGIAVSSGTAALHGCMFGLDLKPGDEVITSPMTFAATSNAVLYMGAKPVFADIDSHTGNIDPHEIEKKITKRTKAIVAVHFSGLPCNMEVLRDIANRNNLKLVEDAAHALGAEYEVNGQWYKVGSCSHSDMAIFSFHPVKHITTGEGGMILANDESLEKKARSIRMHGINTDIRKRLNKKFIWLYEMTELGFNYRITDFQCALGISQLKKIDSFIERRREIAGKYETAFKSMDELTLPNPPEPTRSGLRHAWHLYVIQLNLEKLSKTREDIFFALREENVVPQIHYIPVHYHPYYQKILGFKKGDFPVAESFYERILSLPLFPMMSDEDVSDCIKAVKKVLHHFKTK